MGALWAFVGVAALVIVTPGPDTALTVRNALLGGRRIPIAGRVTMDMTMFDVTGTDAALGDVVTLLGRDGGDVISIAELAKQSELSPYEVLTGLRERLPRHYVHEEQGAAAA